MNLVVGLQKLLPLIKLRHLQPNGMCLFKNCFVVQVLLPTNRHQRVFYRHCCIYLSIHVSRFYVKGMSSFFLSRVDLQGCRTFRHFVSSRLFQFHNQFATTISRDVSPPICFLGFRFSLGFCKIKTCSKCRFNMYTGLFPFSYKQFMIKYEVDIIVHI